MQTWSNHERYRSELFKILGIAIMSPFFGMCFNNLVYGFNTNKYELLRFVISMIFLGVGLIPLAIGLDILSKIDEDKEYERRDNG